MRAEPVAPQAIAGGFVLIPVRQIMAAWRACRRGPLGIADFRTWLACREMVARRCTLDRDRGRSPTYGLAELSRLTGVSPRRARASVRRLGAAGLLTWSEDDIGFPDGGSRAGASPHPDDGDDPLTDTIGGGQGSLAIPRRVLRLLVGGARPALIATTIAILLRCLARGRGGFHSRGRVKASWIALVFDVDLRRVKQARKDLVDLGWIVPEQTHQWTENRWGRVYHIDLGWDRTTALTDGRRLPPPPPRGGHRLPPPDSHPEPLREDETQEPAPGGPAGDELNEEESIPTPPTAPADPPYRRGGEQDPVTRRPALAADGAGTSPSTVERRPPLPRRPCVIAAGAGEGPLPAPTLTDVRVEDLKDTGRLLRLHAQSVARELVGSSEADRLQFVGAAEHALALGTVNPCGLFMYLVRGRLWRYLTQADEDRAHARLKRELRGEPAPRSGVGPGASWCGPELSSDAVMVREVRSAVIRAGHYRDPYAAFARVTPGWTRGRWDRALSELGL